MGKKQFSVPTDIQILEMAKVKKSKEYYEKFIALSSEETLLAILRVALTVDRVPVRQQIAFIRKRMHDHLVQQIGKKENPAKKSGISECTFHGGRSMQDSE